MIGTSAQTNLENFIQSAFQVAALSITLNPYQGLKPAVPSPKVTASDSQLP